MFRWAEEATLLHLIPNVLILHIGMYPRPPSRAQHLLKGRDFDTFPLHFGDHLQTSPDSRNSKASMTCPCCWQSAPGRKYSGPWGFSWAGLEWLQWLPTKSFGTFESAMESRPESEDLKNISGIGASFICPSLEFGHTKSVENLNGQDCELKKVLNWVRHGGLW